MGGRAHSNIVPPRTGDRPVGRCVRCGSEATRSCFLFSARSGGGAVPGGVVEGTSGVPIEDADLEAESFFVCETCISRVIGRRRYGGIAAGGILLFFGLVMLLTMYDDAQALGLAVALAGVVWTGWTLLDTHNARDDSAVQIAKEGALTDDARRYWSREEYEAEFGRRPAAGARFQRLSDR